MKLSPDREDQVGSRGPGKQARTCTSHEGQEWIQASSHGSNGSDPEPEPGRLVSKERTSGLEHLLSFSSS